MFAASLAPAQTTLRLRYGGPQSSYRITGISRGTPAQVSVADWNGAAEHAFVPGDQIYIHLVPGCPEANGYRVVASTTPNSFTITDQNGNAITCSVPFDAQWQSGYVGKWQTVTLNPHPRLAAPQNGPIYQRMVDPDGIGPQVAGMAAENGPAWQGLRADVGGLVSPACDGMTRSACPNEAAGMAYTDAGPNENVLEGWSVLALAMVWQADNSQLKYLHAAQYYINHADQLLWENTALHHRPGFACDYSADACGVGSGDDWISADITVIVKAYDMIRNTLTPDQRQRFANVLLNGWNGTGCVNQLTKQSGTVSISGNTVTGTGFASIFKDSSSIANYPANWIYIKNIPTWGATGTFASITSVTDTALTLAGNPGVTANNVDFYSIAPWDPATSCGALYAAGAYAYYDGNIYPAAATTTVGAIDAAGTTLNVAQAGNFTDPPPYYITVGNEVMLVTAVSGNSLTVVRGQLYSQPASHGTGSFTVWTRQPKGKVVFTAGPAVVGGDWRINLVHQKMVGEVMAGLALADEDPRAAALAEAAWNGYYDLEYPYISNMWGGVSQGGWINWGYQWGRWIKLLLNVMIAGQSSFSDYAFTDLNGSYMWRGLTIPMLWSIPGSNFTNGPQIGGNDHYTGGGGTGQSSLAFMPISQTFWPGPAADQATYFWRMIENGSYAGGNGLRAAVWVAPYYDQSIAGSDFRAADPWFFTSDTDWGAPRSLGMMISRTDWTSNASLLIGALGLYEITDHDADQSLAVAPGSYMAFKGSALLLGGDDSYGMGGGSLAKTNWFSIASTTGAALRNANMPSWVTGTYDGAGGPAAAMDRHIGTATYTYARGNLSNAWRTSVNVAHSYRHLVHWKGAAADYIIAFDDHASNGPSVMNTSLFYYAADDASTSFLWDPVANQASSTKPTMGQMITTQLLFPGGAPTATVTPYTCKPGSAGCTSTTYSNRLALSFGTVRSAQVIAVHRLAAVGDVMPTVTQAATDHSSTAAQVDDGDNSLAVVFSADGKDTTARSVTTTYAGQGQVLFTGLLAGNYALYCDGSAVGAGQKVDVDGTILIAAAGPHTWRVQHASRSLK